MKRKAIVGIVVLLASVGSLFSQSATTVTPSQAPRQASPTHVQADQADPLLPIAWLKGGTWVAEVKDKEGVVQTRIENRIRGSANGHLIKFITTFISHNKPEVHYEGIYAYDPGKKQIGFWYTSNDGDFTSGYVSTSGNSITHDFEIAHMAAGKVDKLRSLIVRDGDDAYNWSVSSQKTGQWVELLHLRYVREREEK